MSIRNAVTWLRQPEYTGVNRCFFCTLLNLCIGGVLAGIVTVGWTPILGVAVFAFSCICIYFRGYLVPGTPTITKWYFPPWIRRHFGTESAFDNRSEQSSQTGQLGKQLFTNSVLIRDGDEVTVMAEARSEWTNRMTTITEHEIELDDLRTLFDAEAVTRHGDRSFVIDGNKSVRWGSNAAVIADIAADELLRERLSSWSTININRRQSILRGLRLCLDACPSCGGSLAIDEQRVDPCCDRPHLVAQSVCTNCDAVLADAAVVDSSETTSVRRELLQS